MTTFRTLATVRHHGMELTDYEFGVRLDNRRERRCRFSRGQSGCSKRMLALRRELA